MSAVRSRGPIVIDTDVFSADLVPGSRLAERYAPIITGRPAFISFQTVAELRYGAIRRGWGRARMLKLEAKIQRVEVVHSGPELVAIYARLRADCEATGRALWQKAHCRPLDRGRGYPARDPTRLQRRHLSRCAGPQCRFAAGELSGARTRLVPAPALATKLRLPCLSQPPRQQGLRLWS